MAVEWEYIGSFGLEKEITRQDALPDNETDYVEPEYYDIKTPSQTARFRAIGMTLSEFTSLESTLSVRGQLVSLTDNTGRVWTGKFRSLSGEVISGTDRVGSIELAIILR